MFSRLAWPGYTATAGSFAAPERGYLLTLHLQASDEGKTVTVEFHPPGWPIELGSAIAALAIAVGWTALWWAKRRRNPQPETM